MVIIDPIHMDTLRKLFPELSEKKLEIVVLYAYGMTKKEIAAYKEIHERSVLRALSEAGKDFGASNAESIRLIVFTRLIFNLLSR